MIAYEIHRFRDGKWRIDSVLDDRDLAVREASSPYASRGAVSARVVEEFYEESEGRMRRRVIHRWGADKRATMPSGSSERPDIAPPPAAPQPAARGGRPVRLLMGIGGVALVAAAILHLL